MTDAAMSKIFALPLRLGCGTRNEAQIFDRNGDLVGECVDDDCEERALALVRAVNAHSELTASEKATFDIAARLLKERDAANATIAALVDWLNEIAAQDRRNFPPHGGHISALAVRAFKRAKTPETYDPTTQPFDEPFRHVDRQTCEYCGDGKRTGLPGNACENCMDTGLKRPEHSK